MKSHYAHLVLMACMTHRKVFQDAPHAHRVNTVRLPVPLHQQEHVMQDISVRKMLSATPLKCWIQTVTSDHAQQVTIALPIHQLLRHAPLVPTLLEPFKLILLHAYNAQKDITAQLQPCPSHR